MHLRTVSVLAVVLGFVPRAAGADGPRFGAAGQLVLSDDQSIGGVLGTLFSTTGTGPVPPSSTSAASFEFASVSNNGGTGTSFAVAPAADYFVARGFSLGANGLIGVLSPAHQDGTTGVTDTLFGIAPRVGYNFSFTDNISFWPKVYFQYTTISESNSGASANATAVGVFAPFLFHLVPHFFIGIGPNFWTQLSNNQSLPAGSGGSVPANQQKVTAVGVQMTLGGWLLGD